MHRRKLKIALVGAGLIGRTHVERIRGAAQLHAIVDPADNAKHLAAEIGVPWFADLDACFASVRPDGVIVASPNALHFAHGSACLNAGLPVLIEKPLAESVASAKSLVQLAAKTGVPILVGHHRRHSPLIDAARSVIAQGRLGRLVTVNALFWLNKPADYFDVAWRTLPGAGPTYINLIHDIDLLQHLCGPIQTVQAREANQVRGYEVEDTSAIILTFANGVLGTVTVSDAVSAPWSWELTSGENPAYPKTDQSCYMIGGTIGALSLPDLRVWSHEGPQSWWSPMACDPVDVQPHDPVVAQFQHFLDLIEGTADPKVSAEDGLRNIEVLDAIKRAAQSGGIVPVG
ncbi:MAG: Gfo/Idh/MocA family oxidoreductase [Pseudomonadota bacterium]